MSAQRYCLMCKQWTLPHHHRYNGLRVEEEPVADRGPVEFTLLNESLARRPKEGPLPVTNRSPVQNVLLDLPEGAAERKSRPVGTGVLDYFPMALAEVAKVSKQGNDQHNPGQPLHWARGKSADHWDCIVRHGMQRGTVDSDGQRHSAKLAWRALALLQEELEAEAGFKPEAS